MANNLQRGFTLEYDTTLRKRVNCRDCIHADEDGSCNKRGFVFREDGTSYWKTCSFFDMGNQISNKDEKLKSVLKIRKDYLVIDKPKDVKPKISDKKNNGKVKNKNIFFSVKSQYKDLFRKVYMEDENAKSVLGKVIRRDFYESYYKWYEEKDNATFNNAIKDQFLLFGLPEVTKATRQRIRGGIIVNVRPRIIKIQETKYIDRVKMDDFNMIVVEEIAKFLVKEKIIKV